MKNKKIRITIDIFSGRENPVIEYTGKKLDELTERLIPSKKNISQGNGFASGSYIRLSRFSS